MMRWHTGNATLERADTHVKAVQGIPADVGVLLESGRTADVATDAGLLLGRTKQTSELAALLLVVDDRLVGVGRSLDRNQFH